VTATQWLAHYWGWLLFWCIVLGVPGSVAEFGRRTLRTRHRRRLEIIEARTKAAGGGKRAARDPGEPQRSVTGCTHLNVVPVRLSDGTLVRWMCTNPLCRREFPPESAILAEEEDEDP